MKALDLKGIKQYIKYNNLKQADLAEKMGYTQAYLSRVLNGHDRLTDEFIYKFREAITGETPESLKKEKEEYARQITRLENRINQLEKDLENASLDNDQTRAKLDEAYQTIQSLLKKYNITE